MDKLEHVYISFWLIYHVFEDFIIVFYDFWQLENMHDISTIPNM